jgi:1,4-dihydroxy-2-naphthoate octaprenyltransferase
MARFSQLSADYTHRYLFCNKCWLGLTAVAPHSRRQYCFVYTGIGFGALPILGFYFVQTGEYTMPAIIASIPIGILGHNLLLINELPDVDADKKAGRRNLPIVIGKSKASLVYSMLTVVVYLWIIGGVVATWITGNDVIPAYCLIALITIPFAIKAIKGSRQYDDMSLLVPALASNVATFLITTLLLGVGYVLAGAL